MDFEDFFEFGTKQIKRIKNENTKRLFYNCWDWRYFYSFINFCCYPDGGKVVKILTALQGAISGDDAAITFEVGGTAMTNSAITVEYDGSAAGDVDSSEPSAANRVEEGGTIEMITDGGSTGTAKLLVTFVIRR